LHCRPRSKLSRHQLESASDKIVSFSFNLKKSSLHLIISSDFDNSCMYITCFDPFSLSLTLLKKFYQFSEFTFV
jgi:hypothetical protein